MNRAERRKLKAPVAALVAARNAHCSHCPAVGRITGKDEAGSWQVQMTHSPTCPRITGQAGRDLPMLAGVLAGTREFYRTASGKPFVLELHDSPS